MILEEIVEKRKKQLQREMRIHPLDEIKREIKHTPPPLNFKKALQKERIAIIAEVKKASPSKGLICPDFRPTQIALQYEAAGADAVSVLTEEAFFQGSSVIMRKVRASVRLPVLRKDFIIDPYQIYESRTMGVDAILLIASLLDSEKLAEYKRIADSLGLACLMEAHNEAELERVLKAGAEIVGINNRDLTTFRVDLGTTTRLAQLVPKQCVLVSESGFHERADILLAERTGADAVLIGETLMRSGDPSAKLRELRGVP
jgi:indole-3-glycerol phosphate synthase